MEKKDNMPLWAYWALLGIKTRKTAMKFFIGSLILSVVITIYGVFIKDYSLASLFFVPLWYWISIKWVDVYSTWAQPENS
ncbi:hypothetical protein [Psychromonas aquimarina]|uniref:hypothetical protein n=1 Tax=Psychromonas aquimarina TaxID=444919 RepID=UPI0004294911|nr:hypothetical protein [Psychromonas aquimarina]